MNPADNDIELQAPESALHNDSSSIDYPNTHQDDVQAAHFLENGPYDVPDITSSSKLETSVIALQSLAHLPSNSQLETTDIRVEDNGDGSDSVISCYTSKKLNQIPSIPTNAFEIDLNSSPNDFDQHLNSNDQTYNSDTLRNKDNDPMCVQNIEDENMGRMVYNREPLSMIMEGNSPVAEVAPIIVINQGQGSHSYVEHDLIKTSSTDITNHNKNMSMLKSEIILPSKSKIPQGTRGIKAMQAGHRLYLTGLKKSTSLHSHLSITEHSPRNHERFPEIPICTEQDNDTQDISGLSTPTTNMSEVADIRSKLLVNSL